MLFIVIVLFIFLKNGPKNIDEPELLLFLVVSVDCICYFGFAFVLFEVHVLFLAVVLGGEELPS